VGARASGTGMVSVASLHNLIGWDLRTVDGWQRITAVEHRRGDTIVSTPQCRRGWAFTHPRRVEVRAPAGAVHLDCGHLGGASERRPGQAFCWLGHFRWVRLR
jgi:hypothetical protein